MKALILSTATGGGHNTAAHAVMEALTERGVECRFEDCVAFGGQKLSATVSNVYVKFVQAAPDAFGRLYRFAKAISTPRIKSPVYLFNAAYARKMEQLLTDYARTLCEEAGADTLAWCAGFAGRCLVLAAAFPLLEEICQKIWGLAA